MSPGSMTSCKLKPRHSSDGDFTKVRISSYPPSVWPMALSSTSLLSSSIQKRDCRADGTAVNFIDYNMG